MIFNVFHFKSLKLVIAKVSDDKYIGYSVDTKYSEYSRSSIRGSAKEVVETCIYIYKARLLTAYNCENYEWDLFGNYAGMSLEDSADNWVEYVLNRYLFSTFNMGYEHHYEWANLSCIAYDGTPGSYKDLVSQGIVIKHYDA